MLGFIIGTFLALSISAASYYFKFLSASGSAAMFFTGSIIFGFGSWMWSVPIVTFFILSSLLSKAGKSRKLKDERIFEKGSRRDHAQVLANGGAALIIMILFIFYQNPCLYIFYLAALASATADTWATEIGTLARQSPRLITTLKPVAPGTSGGVTLVGLLSSAAGALVISLSGGWFFSAELHHSYTSLMFIITLSGLGASLVDSLLGATLQIQYRHPKSGNLTERACDIDGSPNIPVSGLTWMNNDMVNFLSSLSALLLTYLGIQFI